MKKLFYLVLLLPLLVPIQSQAAIFSIETSCKKTQTGRECRLFLITPRTQVKGISYQYKNKEEDFQFLANSNWELDQSNEEGVILIRKKIETDKQIEIGTIQVPTDGLEKLELKNIDIAYSCGNTYCDDLQEKFTINLLEDTKKKGTDYTFVMLSIAAVLLILLLFLILRRKRKRKFESYEKGLR